MSDSEHPASPSSAPDDDATSLGSTGVAQALAACGLSLEKNQEPQTSNITKSGLPQAPDPRPLTPPHRRYTVSDKARAARLANLAKANAVDPKIRLRNTPRREAARRRNLERAWARQRDPNQIPGGRVLHGACSKDLKRTAPLAGEDPAEQEALAARLLAMFPVVSVFVGRCIRRTSDRIARVRRVVASRAHQERLLFYQALFEAAAEACGLGIERVRRLAEDWTEALDLGSERDNGFAQRVLGAQRRMLSAVKTWMHRVFWAACGKPRARPRRKRQGPGFGWEPMPMSAWSPAAMADWIAREFAKRNWRLPTRDDSGFRMHAWLVRAAVVGGDHVHEPVNAELDEAIQALAEATWCRLLEIPLTLEEVETACAVELAAIADEQKAEAQKRAAFRARPEAAEGAGDRKTALLGRTMEGIGRGGIEESRIERVIRPWAKLDPVQMVALIRDSNQRVQQALGRVTRAVEAELEFAAASGSGLR